jgi:hypothetical protein
MVYRNPSPPPIPSLHKLNHDDMASLERALTVAPPGNTRSNGLAGCLDPDPSIGWLPKVPTAPRRTPRRRRAGW